MDGKEKSLMSSNATCLLLGILSHAHSSEAGTTRGRIGAMEIKDKDLVITGQIGDFVMSFFR